VTFIDYLDWNEALAKYFFRREFAQQPVFLAVTPEILGVLAPDIDDPQAHFVRCCRRGVCDAPPGDICVRAIEAQREWDGNRDRDWPSVIGYLSLFALAAGLYDEDASTSNEYYDRLRQLTNHRGNFQQFDHMSRLWRAVSEWSRVEGQGRHGLLVENRFAQEHVGWPRSQVLLRERDRQELPRLFHTYGFIPERLPREDALWAALLSWRWERNGANALFNGNNFGEQRSVLVETVYAELARFDPDDHTLWNRPASNRALGENRQYELRLCLDNLSAGNASVQSRLRLFSAQGLLPAIVRLLSPLGGNNHWECDHASDGWSDYILGTDDDYVKGTEVDWQNGTTLKIIGGGRVCLKARQVRFLTRSAERGWQETLQVPHGEQFLILSRDSAGANVEAWGRNACPQPLRLLTVTGLAEGWRLYQGKDAEHGYGDATHGGFALATKTPFGIRLRGGLRAHLGNTFFASAPPDVYVNGVQHIGVTITCYNVDNNDEVAVTQDDDDNQLWHLENPECSGSFLIEANFGGEIKRLSFALEVPSTQKIMNPPWRDGLGREPQSSYTGPRIAGALVADGDFPRCPPPVPFRDPFTYLGRIRGQVSHMNQPGNTDKNFPEWEPVWILRPLGQNQREAIFVGEDYHYDYSAYPPTLDIANAYNLYHGDWRALFGPNVKIHGTKEQQELWQQYRAGVNRL